MWLLLSQPISLNLHRLILLQQLRLLIHSTSSSRKCLHRVSSLLSKSLHSRRLRPLQVDPHLLPKESILSTATINSRVLLHSRLLLILEHNSHHLSSRTTLIVLLKWDLATSHLISSVSSRVSLIISPASLKLTRSNNSRLGLIHSLSPPQATSQALLKQ
jgi:hypothetical protein